MRKIIHHLRNKSESERRDILHLCTVVFALILLTLWIYSLGQNLSNPSTQNKIKEDLQPFSVLKDNIVGGYKDVTDSNLNEIE